MIYIQFMMKDQKTEEEPPVPEDGSNLSLIQLLFSYMKQFTQWEAIYEIHLCLQDKAHVLCHILSSTFRVTRIHVWDKQQHLPDLAPVHAYSYHSMWALDMPHGAARKR